MGDLGPTVKGGAVSRVRAFRTRDLDAAKEHITRAFVQHEMHVKGDGSLDLALSELHATRMSISKLRYGAHATLEVPAMREWYHVNVVLRGETRVAQGHQRRTTSGGTSAAVFRPDDPVTIDWTPEAEVFAIKIPREALESLANRLGGYARSEVIDFDLSIDLTGPGRTLLSTAGFLYRELRRPDGLITMPAACAAVENALMSELLTIAKSPDTWTPMRSSALRRAWIDQAVDLIDQDPASAASTAWLAARVGVSERALQAGFHEVFGLSPTAYRRAVRLDRVRQDLLRHPDASVTDVATQWGFFHPGRFASHYRERFGELPSQTRA